MQIQGCAAHVSTTRRQAMPYARYYILVLILALVMIPGIVLYHPPLAHALGPPTLTWDSTMIYSGQNNGNPWGPPGEHALVHGSGFQLEVGKKLGLVLTQGNSDTNALVCNNGLVTVAQITVPASGNFEQFFVWPTTLVNKPGVEYSICAQNALGHVISSKDDPGPFTVLTPNAPSFSLSTNNIAAGGTITANGQNWVPDQEVEVDVTFPNNSGSITHALVNSGGGLQGTFSASLTIPTSTTPGNYAVTVFSTQNNLLSTSYTHGNRNLAVTGAGTTPTPTAALTPTPTTASPTPTVAAATPTGTAAGTGGSNNNRSSNSGNKTLFYLLLAAIAVVLLVIGGLLTFMLAQRRKQISTLLPGQFGSPGILPNRSQGFVPGRICTRCGAPLSPQTPVCGNCGLENVPISYPNRPNRAY